MEWNLLYFKLKVIDLFKNSIRNDELYVIQRKESLMHKLFNHKYTFLYLSIQNNIIYSHISGLHTPRVQPYTHEESRSDST